ncbi:MAG TPA: protein kinase [Bdellovibrionota bacterium]|nr:protein kinase [Bdellovibrionota bacterium]
MQSARWMLVLGWSALSLFAVSSAEAALRVAVAPIRGDARYPLAMGGLRQVLTSDLGQTGQFEIQELDIPENQLTASNLPNLASRIAADVVLIAYFVEGSPRFTVTLRAYDVQTGYNLGSRDVAGSYGEIKVVQDRLLASALELLRIPITEVQRAAITKVHTKDMGAVVALGEAESAIRDKNSLGAIEGFAKARALDRQFRAPQFQLERSAPALVQRLTNASEKGRALAFMGDASQSMALFDEVLKKNPAEVSALVGKADLLLQTGRAGESVQFYKQAATVDPKNAAAIVGLARAYQEMGNSAEALATYEQAKNLGATEPEIYESLGSLYAARRQTKDAAEAYQTAGELAQRAAKLQSAQRYYARAGQLAPSVQAMQREAELFITSGELELAITTLTKALILAPENDGIYSRLGYAYFLSRQPGEAIQKLRKAYNLNAENYEANLYLGILLLEEREQRTEAIRHLENAARLRPGDADIQYRLAQAYMLDRRVGSAITLLQKITQAHPREARAHMELGDAFFTGEDYAHAEEEYLRATELNPDYQEAYEALARCYLKLGKRDQALDLIQKVYAIDATDNVFVREGTSLLAGMTSKELLQICLMFPKVVPVATGNATINQVTVVRVQENRSLAGRIADLFRFYTLNEGRIRRDLEFAMLAQYRVVPVERLKGFTAGTMKKDVFTVDGLARDAAAANSLDGIIGYEITGVFPQDQVAEVAIDVSLYSVPDRMRYNVPNRAALPRVAYPRTEILRFNILAVLYSAAALALLLTPLLYVTVYQSRVRGKGHLRVVINYDPKLESFLTLKLSKKQEKERDSRVILVKDQARYNKRKYKQLLQQKGTWVRKMVGRTTLFEKVPASSYYCYLYGTIEDTKVTKSTIGNYFMVQRVLIEKDRTNEIVFQLEKEEAFVTVFVRKGEEDINGAEIRVEGDPEVKFSRGATGAFVYLKQGKHKIRVTHGGRTVEQAVDIYTLDDKVVNIDLQTADEAEQAAIGGRELTEVAQQFEEQGRSEDAARLYEKAGAADRATEVRAQAMMSEGNLEAAAEELVKAREFIKAAEIYSGMGNMEKANYLYGLHCYQAGEFPKAAKYLENSNNHALLAKIYEKMGDKKKAQTAIAHVYLQKGQKIEAAQAFVHAECWVEAAEIYESLEDFSKAALLYVKDGNYSLAGDLFMRAGDMKKAAMAFEKGGLNEQAISTYRDLGEMDKVIELMVRDERFYEGAQLYQQQGLVDEAIALCQKVPSYHTDYPRTRLLLGQIFVEKGMDDLALKTFTEAKESTAVEFDLDSSYAYGMLLERKGEYSSALDVFDELLKRDFHYKDVSVKVGELKQKVEARKSRAPSATASETISGETPQRETRYEIIEELGRGAMGIVYKAKDKMLDRIVAFKTLPHTLKDDPQALESLLKEAQTAAKLNHPNIVTVYDVGQENGSYFIAMEFLQGKTLQQVLKQVKKVDLPNFLHIAKALCDVIGYAHEQKVIHRDIKPSNILLLPNRSVKLMDFGLAKVLQEMSIDKTMLRGTPLYMSPEQVLGKDIDQRTDIYSMGVLFYEMLAGTPPFFKGDIMYAHLHTPPPPLAPQAEGVPGAITDVVMSCLSKDKAGRPSTARDIIKVLAAMA